MVVVICAIPFISILIYEPEQSIARVKVAVCDLNMTLEYVNVGRYLLFYNFVFYLFVMISTCLLSHKSLIRLNKHVIKYIYLHHYSTLHILSKMRAHFTCIYFTSLASWTLTPSAYWIFLYINKFICIRTNSHTVAGIYS